MVKNETPLGSELVGPGAMTTRIPFSLIVERYDAVRAAKRTRNKDENASSLDLGGRF